MAELKQAYEGIDTNPKLEPRQNAFDPSGAKPIKPTVAQLQTDNKIYSPELDGEDENLRELDLRILEIRMEMEKNYAQYYVLEILRLHKAQYVPHVPPKHPYCGLENDQFVCYSNSVLQILYTCTRIRQYLLAHSNSGPLHTLLFNLFSAMVDQHKSHKPDTTPKLNPEKQFNPEFRKVRPEFKRNEMHDAQEFLTILVELVHQEANAANANRAHRPTEAPDFASAAEQWSYHRTYVDDSPLSKLLMGQLESTLTCRTCGNKSRSWTAIWQLQLHLEPEDQSKVTLGNDTPLNINDCIKEFTAPEVSASNEQGALCLSLTIALQIDTSRRLCAHLFSLQVSPAMHQAAVHL